MRISRFNRASGFNSGCSTQFDFRAGLSDFHFSNGFVVPNSPGIDEMSYNAGLSYHLTKRKAPSL